MSFLTIGVTGFEPHWHKKTLKERGFQHFIFPLFSNLFSKAYDRVAVKSTTLFLYKYCHILQLTIQNFTQSI